MRWIWAQKWFLTHLLLQTITFLVHKWPNGRHVFLPTNKTFEGICLALAGTFREKEWWIFFNATLNLHYYSFKIFPQFWLGKSTRIIHHSQLLMTKFARILNLTRKWRQKCSLLQVKAPLTEKAWERGWAVLVVNTQPHSLTVN